MSCYVEPAGDELWLGADVLGMFPLYYHATPERLIFATSPALVAADPWFDASLDVRGLVGNLLTMHMVGGHTLWVGVRRLTPGHALRWRQGEAAREIPVRVLTPGDKYFGESPAQHVDRSDEALDRAVRLDASNGGTALLLSGGLDSRLLAAYLRRAIDGPVDGITCGRRGRPGDGHRQPRRPAAPAGRSTRSSPTRTASSRSRSGTWPTSSSATASTTWRSGTPPRPRPRCKASRVFTGVMGDTVMGGEHIPWGYDPERRAYSFDTLFARINRYGFTPEQIRRLDPPRGARRPSRSRDDRPARHVRPLRRQAVPKGLAVRPAAPQPLPHRRHPVGGLRRRVGRPGVLHGRAARAGGEHAGRDVPQASRAGRAAVPPRPRPRRPAAGPQQPDEPRAGAVRARSGSAGGTRR